MTPSQDIPGEDMNFGNTTVRNAHSTPQRFRQMSAAALTTCVGLLIGTSAAGDVQSPMRVAEPTKQVTTATQITEHGTVHFRVSNNVIVRTDDGAYLAKLVNTINSQFPGVTLGDAMGKAGDVFAVNAPDVATALRVRNFLRQSSSVLSAELDRKQYDPTREQRLLSMYSQAADQRSKTHAVGIEPVRQTESARGGGPDPLISSQWHLVNSGGSTFTGNDNNLTPTIYDTLGITGLGVNVAISTLGHNLHIDTDHNDLADNFSLALSQAFDPSGAFESRPLTQYAGIISSVRGNAIGGQGVAPGSNIATVNWGVTDLTDFEAYDWKTNTIAIKAYQTSVEYDFPGSQYNTLGGSEYVMDPLVNSIQLGRNGKGVFNVFGTGVGFNLLPDPYFFPPAGGDTFSPTDELTASGNTVLNGLNFGFSTGPYYVGGQISHFPPAVNRRSIVMNTVSEDSHYDSFSGTGTAIFASVYAGASNNFFAGLAGEITGRGLLTTAPNGSSTDIIPLDDSSDVFNANMSGTSVTAGIIALMLEANPRLKPRDIQHIFFRSIQESTRPASVKWPQFDTTRLYYSPFVDPATRMSFWGLNTGLYTRGDITNQAIRHSDQYGFGMVDAELAVQMAATYSGSPKLFLLDTGIVGDVNDGTEREDDFRLPIAINDATFFIGLEADGTTGIDGAATLIPGAPNTTLGFCVRQNISIEAIIVELTIEGLGSNDLYIELTSPHGTRSILSMPTTSNLLGSADDDVPIDDDLDIQYNSGTVNGTDYAFYQHPFLTWKHWGELSGGVWGINFLDFGPDDETPEGVPAGTGPMPDPGADMVTSLGQLGVPGSQFRDDKEVVGFRVKIYGSDTGLPIFEGCNPFATSCPGDIDGNGIINFLDLQIFLNWFVTGNALADMNDDGSITFSDLLAYRALWVPGFCVTGDNSFVGGRPFPGTSNSNNGSDNNPVVRPI